MIALGTGPFSAATTRVGGSGGPPPPPTPVFTRIVIEGDSITSGSPQQTGVDDEFYSYAWKAAHPALTSFVTGQGSRTVGGGAMNGDLADGGTPTGNTLSAHTADDLALAPQLVTAKIGVNDVGSTGISVPTYIQRLKSWAAQIRAGGAKIAYCVPTPTAVGSAFNQAQVDAYMAKWTSLFTTQAIRNPANWSQWADYYIPMGEHPAFREPAQWTVDGVHPTAPVSTAASGQAKLYAVYSAAMNTLLDTSRVTAAGPYESVWDAFGPFNDLAVGVPITRRVILSGLAWAGRTEGVSVTGGDAAVKTNSKTAPGYSYNGDTVDLTLTPSASHETDTVIQLTIAGETRTRTYRTVADVAPAVYQHGDIVGAADGDTGQTLTGLTFAAGRAVVMLKASRTVQSTVVNLNGSPMTLRRREVTQSEGAIELWDAPVAAGTNHALAITYGSNISNRVVSYGTVTGGSFVSATGNAPGGQSAPHETPSVTVPTNGIAVAGFLESGGATITPATTNAGTTLIDEHHLTFQGGTDGIALATRTTTGAASFNFAFGTFARVIAVYQAG